MATPRYNQETVKKALEQRSRKLAVGLYRIRVLGALVKEPKEPKFNLSHELVIGLLKSDGELSTIKARHYVTFPLINTAVDGHEPPNTGGLTIPLVQAMFPSECPLYPRRDPKTKKLMYQDGEIDPAQQKDAEAEAAEACLAKLDHMEQHPEEWEGKECFAYVSYQKDKDTQVESDFPSFGRFQAELREGQSVVADDKWFSGGSGDEKGAEAAKKAGIKPSASKSAGSKASSTFKKKTK